VGSEVAVVEELRDDLANLGPHAPRRREEHVVGDFFVVVVAQAPEVVLEAGAARAVGMGSARRRRKLRLVSE